jgi:hypothetical protein
MKIIWERERDLVFVPFEYVAMCKLQRQRLETTFESRGGFWIRNRDEQASMCKTDCHISWGHICTKICEVVGVGICLPGSVDMGYKPAEPPGRLDVLDRQTYCKKLRQGKDLHVACHTLHTKEPHRSSTLFIYKVSAPVTECNPRTAQPLHKINYENSQRNFRYVGHPLVECDTTFEFT